MSNELNLQKPDQEQLDNSLDLDKQHDKIEDGEDVRADYNPTELVIKEMMVNKGVDRDTAIKILKNPS